MRAQETAQQVTDSLADDVTMGDIIHARHINIKFSRGQKETRENNGVPHADAKKRLGR